MLGARAPRRRAGDLDEVQPVVERRTRCARRAPRSTPRGSSDEVARYVVDVVRRTRELPSVELGAARAPRVHLLGAARAAARLAGRDFVTPDDVVAHGARRAAPPARPARPRPSSSATAPTTPCGRRSGDVPGAAVSPDAARRRPRSPRWRCSPRSSVPPSVAAARGLALAGATVADALAVAGAGRGRARRSRRSLARGVPAPLTVDAAPPAPARCACASRSRPTSRSSRARPTAALDGAPHAARGAGATRSAPVAARTEGPLGLGRWHHAGGSARPRCSSTPTCPPPRRLALAVRQGRFRDQGRLTRGPLGLGTDFESIRDYLPDDDVRQINWRATDRAGRPMSNQYRVEQDREVMLLVDAGRLMAAPLGDRTRLDAAVDAARRRRARRRRGRRPLRRRSPSTTRSAAALPPRRARRRRRRRARSSTSSRARSTPTTSSRSRPSRAPSAALIVIFTDLLEEAAARPLVDAVPVLARRHAVVVASVARPGPRRPARAPRRRTAARRLRAQAVALDVLAARARVAHGLRARRARASSRRPPSALPAACVRAYLRAKARARL